MPRLQNQMLPLHLGETKKLIGRQERDLKRTDLPGGRYVA